MLTQREEYERNVLRILSESTEPVGSVSLSLTLSEQDIGISSATVGRLLTELDRRKLTAKQGYRGRTLTAAGKQRLNELELMRELAEASNKFHKSIDVDNKNDLINILTARRGIEREIARLAAINATEEDIRAITDAYSLQSVDVAHGRVSPENDVAFHRAIGRASKNSVLAAAYDFIWQNGKLSPVMEYVRTYVGGTISSDHRKILDAIVAKDSEGAEKAMVRHIESMIGDVNKYWSLASERP